MRILVLEKLHNLTPLPRRLILARVGIDVQLQAESWENYSLVTIERHHPVTQPLNDLLARDEGSPSAKEVAHASPGALLPGQMFSRSRTRLRLKGRATDLINTHPRPSAPLEFLYPRWFTEARARSYSSKARPVPNDANEPSGGQDNVTRQSIAKTPQYEDVRHKPLAEALWAGYKANIQHWDQVRRDLHELDVVVRRRKELAKAGKKRLQSRTGEPDTVNKGVLPARATSRPAFRLRRTKTDGSEPMSRKAIRKLLMKTKHDPSQMEWTVPARILSKALERPMARDGEELLLAERTVISLTGTGRANAWIHRGREDCEIRVLSRSVGWNGKRKVLLHGSSLAREATKEYLLAQDARVMGSPLDSLEDKDIYLEGSGRWVPSRARSDEDLEEEIRADALPVPETWTVKTFAQYVEDLCAMRLTRARQRELYPFDDTYNQNVAMVLENLFTTEELVPHISSYALNVALQFACEHSELRRTQELLYSQAKRIGLHRQIWTYNLLIERALKMNETDTLGDLVRDMQVAGVVPNGLTWAKLLLVVDSTFARRNLLDFILRNYPDEFDAVMNHLSRRLIQKEMPEIARRSDGFQFFVDRMEKAFGSSWLKGQTLNRVLNTCAQHELWEVGANTLKLASEKGVPMTPGNVDAMIDFYYRKDDLEAAIDLLRSPWVHELGYSSEKVIPTLFSLAWNRERWNVCRVLWQYAASRGLISYQMQMRVQRSLTRNQHLAVLPPHRTFKNLAGKLVIGADLDTTNFNEQFPRLSKYFSTTNDPIQWLAQWTPNDGTREEQLSLVYVLINRDLEAWKVLKPIPKHDLPALLNSARRRDQAWVAQKFDHHATLAEMRANAIQVPLFPAEGCPEYHTGSSPSGNSPVWTLQESGAQLSWKLLRRKTDNAVARLAISALSQRLVPQSLCATVAFLHLALSRVVGLPDATLQSVWHLLVNRFASRHAPAMT